MTDDVPTKPGTTRVDESELTDEEYEELLEDAIELEGGLFVGPQPDEDEVYRGDMTPQQIRDRIPDDETAEEVIEELRRTPGTKVREVLGPPEDEDD